MKYNIYTLGCKVNEYESEVMDNIMQDSGYTKSDTPDICIINTCTVTNKADNKSKKLIRSLKGKYPNALMIVVGCLIQNKPEVLKELDIDIALGNKDKSLITSYIRDYKKQKISKVYNINDMEFEDMKLNNSTLTRAYIKIQDGCDNYCAFCIIPYVRGHVRSKEKNNVIKEAKSLIKNGHKEIVLTGIHTGNYNDQGYDFADLLSDLVKLDGLERLRISSIEATELNDRVLKIFKENNILVNHLHIPLQSGSDTILKLMNRKYDKYEFMQKIKEIRDIRPNINITTDVIVGFPFETDKLFNETIETIKKIGFTKLHVFPYSKRENTVAASMKNQIDSTIKKERVTSLIKLSKYLEEIYMNKYIGKNLSFIPEVYKDGYLIGHTENFLLIKTKGNKNLLNKTLNVTPLKIEYPHLLGEISKIEFVK